MLEFLNKEKNIIVKAWLVTIFSILFMVTLPIMFVVVPISLSLELVNKTKKPNKNIKMFNESDVFNTWGSFFETKKPGSWD